MALTLKDSSDLTEMRDNAWLPNKILVAIDESEQSRKALAYAKNLAALSKARLVLLHVVLLPLGVSPETLESVRKDMSAKSGDLLRRATSWVETGRISVETRIIETDRSISKSIVDLAAKEKADLIVLGTQGTSGYGRLMLGSTAAGVVSSANCPVLAVR